MRWIMVAWLALVACGPSASEIKTAKLATYHARPLALLQLAMDVTRENGYKVRDAAADRCEFLTQPRVFTHEGGSESAGADDYITIRPGSVEVSLIVRCVEDEGNVTISVTPKTFEWLAGSPQPRELAPDDPSLPPFVLGRADALQLAIYQRAKPYVVASPEGK